MIARRSLLLIFLAVCLGSSQANVRDGGDQANVRDGGDEIGPKGHEFEDEQFWSRFVQEIVSSRYVHFSILVLNASRLV
jgi:hypothetical protein